MRMPSSQFLQSLLDTRLCSDLSPRVNSDIPEMSIPYKESPQTLSIISLLLDDAT
jgi:hypothetical protein